MKFKVFSLVVFLVLAGVASWVAVNQFWTPARSFSSEEQMDAREVAQAIRSLHRDMGPVRTGDWLASHKEAGQTFKQYLQCNPNVLEEKRNKLYIQPIGEFNENQLRIVNLTSEFMALYFDCEVKILETKSTNHFPAKAKRLHSAGMRQLLTTYILYDVLQPSLPDDAFAMIAFTSDDLYPQESWNFVFGQASLRGRVGVWSIYRNGDPETEFTTCLDRTLKTATHETGHMFSIQHCIAYRCNMNGSNNRSESDRHPLFLCPECLPKILVATKSNPHQRFEKLASFCEKNKLEEAAIYYRNAAEKVAELTSENR